MSWGYRCSSKEKRHTRTEGEADVLGRLLRFPSPVTAPSEEEFDQESSPWRIKCVATFPHLLHPQASWATLNMHTFKFISPFALILAVVCLAIATPTSDVHADPGSGAVIHAVGNVPDSAVIKDVVATHLPAATLTTDETGVSTKPCVPRGGPCSADQNNCCSEQCAIFDGLVSAPLLISENGEAWWLTSPSLYQGCLLIVDLSWGLTQVIMDALGCEFGQYFVCSSCTSTIERRTVSA